MNYIHVVIYEKISEAKTAIICNLETARCKGHTFEKRCKCYAIANVNEIILRKLYHILYIDGAVAKEEEIMETEIYADMLEEFESEYRDIVGC